MSVSSIMKLLHAVLECHDSHHRHELIQKFQRACWDNSTASESAVWDRLRELAYDLDFYEPDQHKRQEDASFYGDERLVMEIRDVLADLTMLDPHLQHQGKADLQDSVPTVIANCRSGSDL
jgi:hypothetical protein